MKLPAIFAVYCRGFLEEVSRNLPRIFPWVQVPTGNLSLILRLQQTVIVRFESYLKDLARGLPFFLRYNAGLEFCCG